MAGVTLWNLELEGYLEEATYVQQLCGSGEALLEWRSSEHIENGTPSISPPYWDSDDDVGGWSHFAQFTIAVVNKDPKKFKYSDTLHCFWKKEHDWGWKKFMELSKVMDGFIDTDTLVIKAQVKAFCGRMSGKACESDKG